MFWYVIQLVSNPKDADDYRFTEDRGAAIVAMVVCHMKVMVVCKPLVIK